MNVHRVLQSGSRGPSEPGCCFKAMPDIGDNVVYMLDADRQAHIAIRNAGSQSLFSCELRMGCCRWMNCKAARITNIGDVIVKLQSIDKSAAGFLATGKFKPHEPTEAASQIPVSALAVNSPLHGGMNNPNDLFSLLEKINNRLRIRAVLLHAQRQRFKTLNNKEGIERRKRCANVAK